MTTEQGPDGFAMNANSASGGGSTGLDGADRFAVDPGLLVLKLAIEYLQKAQASGANVTTEAVRLQQLLAGLGAV